MNATRAIRAAQKANPGKAVRQIVFGGEDFTKEAVLRLRDERVQCPPSETFSRAEMCGL